MSGEAPVAVLGAGGIMGFPMARNLARAGIPVRAWNRTPEKARPLAQDGATICATPAEAAHGADMILTMLADADAVIGAIDGPEGAGAAAAAGTLWLQMSTIGEAGTERCIELSGRLSLGLLDAPVLGTRLPAQQGRLVILAAGPPELRERARPVFKVLGERTLEVGEAGAATRLKLVTNSWVLTVVEGCAEAIALAEGLGLDPRLLLEAVRGGALDLPYLQMKGRAIIDRDFEPAFRLELAAKDARLIDEAARRHDLDLPLFATIRERMGDGVAEHGDEDMSATYFASAPPTGDAPSGH